MSLCVHHPVNCDKETKTQEFKEHCTLHVLLFVNNEKLLVIL